MAGNIWCLGRSYAAHAAELGNEVPTSPLIFLKASSCLVENQSEIKLPNQDDEIHHEVEMALKLDENLQISHYAVGIDLTNRTKQQELKSKGHPWTLAKSFTGSCPVGPWISSAGVDLKNLDLVLSVNGDTKQCGNSSLLLFQIDDILNYLKANYPITSGDIIMTGTPKGVGQINSGDQIKAEVGDSLCSWLVV